MITDLNGLGRGRQQSGRDIGQGKDSKISIRNTFFIPLLGSSCGIVRLDYSLVITALSELEAQAFRSTRINIC